MTNVLISAAGLCGATIIGAILGFFVKELPHKWNDAVLGYCAGIMLAASTLGLIVPAFEQTSLWWLVVIGVMAGALFDFTWRQGTVEIDRAHETDEGFVVRKDDFGDDGIS